MPTDEVTKEGRFAGLLGDVDCGDQKSIWIGNYNYKALCMPQWPYCRGDNLRQAPQFFSHNEFIGVFLAMVMGLQHALSMVGGIITVPLIVSYMANDVAVSQFLISSSLIVCGIMTVIHVIQIPVIGTFGRYVYGSGVISVIGISFTFLPIAQKSIGAMMAAGETFDVAYGRFLGVGMVGTFITVAISFMPPKAIRRVFPPMVSGVTIILIGVALITAGFEDWGGGVFCGQNTGGFPAAPLGKCTYINETTGISTVAVDSFTGANITCYAPQFVPMCDGNGEVQLPFGNAAYVGLGFVVFITLCVVELFGTPFMRNIEVVIALLFGYFVAYLTRNNGLKYVTTTNIDNAPVITFL